MRTRKGRRRNKLSSRSRKPSIKSSSFCVEELEPRILFSGGAEGLMGLANSEQLEQSVDISDAPLPTSVFKQSKLLAPNTAPVFSDLDATPTAVERGSPVVLDSDVSIFDAELSAADNFDGARLTLSRTGGANTEDVFSAAGSLDELQSGSAIIVDSTNVGSVLLNGSGFLFLEFNQNATNALVNRVLQQIAYQNTASHANVTPPDVNLQWIFDDRNAGAQGTGGGLVGVGFSTVSFTLANDAPEVLQDAGIVIEDIAFSVDVSRGSALQDDGKLVVAVESFKGPNYQAGVLRFNLDGSLDTSFNGNGVAFLDIGSGDNVFRDVKIQTDGKILLTGFADLPGYDSVLVRYNSDGSLDTSFSGDGIATFDGLGSTDFANEIVLQDDGKIVMVGATHNGTDYDLMVTRHNTDGSLDTSFSGDGMFLMDLGNGDDIGESVALQADGKIVVGGTVNNGANTDFAVWRLNSDGTLDTTFDTDGVVQTDFNASDDELEKVLIQDDGRILLAGDTTIGLQMFGFARYNSDGSLDTSFNSSGTRVQNFGVGNSNLSSAILQDDGKFVAVGRTATGEDDMIVARFNPDGSLDTSFATGGALGIDAANHLDAASDVALQLDGKLVVNGHTNDGGPFRITTLRINSDGVADLSYGAPHYIEGGPEIVIDSDITLFDLELSDADNYSGASINLQRSTGATVDDVFASSGNLDPLVTGGDIVVSSIIIGNVVGNENGLLSLTLNSNATQALVNELMQSITYRNTATDLPNLVELQWTIDDGNAGAQGVGGSLQSTGTSVIRTVDVDRVFVTTTSDISDGDTSSIEALNSNRGADDAISLREAIEAANNTPNAGGADQIHFDLSADDPNYFDIDGTPANGDELWTIDLQSPLDAISDAVLIDARTQAGYEVWPAVEITGYDINGINDGLQFIAGSANSGVRGLSINGFGGNGISVIDATGVSLLQNSLYQNNQLNIDLGSDGVSTNDSDDSDTGANNLQNSPTLHYANAVVPFTVNITGGLQSNPNTSFRIEFYASHAGSDTDPFEAEYYLGSTTAATDNDGSLSFDVDLAATVLDGEAISAIATVDLGAGIYGDSSEISPLIFANTINDAPVVSAPAEPLSAIEQSVLNIHGAGFGVTDADESGRGATALLTVGEGIINVDVGDSDIVVLSGNGSTSVAISASISQLNDLLQGSSSGTIQYLNTLENPSPSTTITLTVNDAGNTGSDPGLSGNASSEQGSNSQLIDLTGVNNDPFNAGILPAQISVIEDLSSPVDLSLLDLVDVDANGGTVSLTLATSTGGLLSASNDDSVVLDGSGTEILKISGTTTALNDYLNNAASLSYVHGTEHINGIDSDEIVLSINDGGNSGTGGGVEQSLGVVGIDIQAVNDEQVVVDSQGEVDEGASSIIITTAMLNTTDVDHSVDQLMYSVDTLPSNGQLQLDGESLFEGAIFSQFDINQGLLTYTHDGSQTSSDIFSFTVDDGQGSTSSASFNWVVNNVNDAPVARGEQFELQQATTFVQEDSLISNDTDEDQDTLKVVLLRAPEHGSLIIDDNGGFQYAPDASFFGIDSFSYQISDGQAVSEEVTVTLAVNASPILGVANNAPVQTLMPEEETQAPISNTETTADDIIESTTEEQKPEQVEEIEEQTTGESDKEPDSLAEEQSTTTNTEGDSPTPGVVRSASAIFSRPLLVSFSSLGNTFSTQFSNASAGQLPQLKNVVIGSSDVAISNKYQRSEFDFQRTELLQQELQQFEALFASDEMSETFNKVEHSLRSEAAIDEKTVQLITSSGIVASVGVISWMFSGGTLLAGMMSTLPTWAGFDPLPIMTKKAPNPVDGKGKNSAKHANEEAESVGALFDR